MTPSSSPPAAAIVAVWNMALNQPSAGSFTSASPAQGLRALICDAANTISVPASTVLVANWTVNTVVTPVPAWVGTNTFSCDLTVPLPVRRLAASSASDEAAEAWAARELQVVSNWMTFVASTTVLNTQSSYYQAAASAGQAPASYMQNQLLSLGNVADPTAQLPITSQLYNQVGVPTSFLAQVVSPQSVVVNDLIVNPVEENSAAPLVIGISISLGAVLIAAVLAVLLFSAAPAGAAAAPAFASKAHAL